MEISIKINKNKDLCGDSKLDKLAENIQQNESTIVVFYVRSMYPTISAFLSRAHH